jgi:hypothetical protein
LRKSFLTASQLHSLALVHGRSVRLQPSPFTLEALAAALGVEKHAKHALAG